MGLGERIAGWWVKDDVEEGKRLDDQLAQLNRDALARGVYTEDQYASAEARRQAGAADTYAGGVVEAFQEGWEDGRENVTTAVRDATAGALGVVGDVASAPFRGLLAGIPWWAWGLGIIGLLAYTGMLPGVAMAIRRQFR